MSSNLRRHNRSNGRHGKGFSRHELFNPHAHQHIAESNGEWVRAEDAPSVLVHRSLGIAMKRVQNNRTGKWSWRQIQA